MWFSRWFPLKTTKRGIKELVYGFSVGFPEQNTKRGSLKSDTSIYRRVDFSRQIRGSFPVEEVKRRQN